MPVLNCLLSPSPRWPSRAESRITARLLNPPTGPRLLAPAASHRIAAQRRNAAQAVRPVRSMVLASLLSPRSASSFGVAAMLLQGVEGEGRGRTRKMCDAWEDVEAAVQKTWSAPGFTGTLTVPSTFNLLHALVLSARQALYFTVRHLVQHTQVKVRRTR